MRDARFPAVEDHLVAGLELGMAGGSDGAGEVDAGNHRPAPDDRRLAGESERILVVERRMADPDGDIALHQVALPELLPRQARCLLTLVGNQGLEPLHHRPPRAGAGRSIDRLEPSLARKLPCYHPNRRGRKTPAPQRWSWSSVGPWPGHDARTGTGACS